MLTNKNILLGYSGHGYVVADAAVKTEVRLGYYADKKESNQNPFNLKYLGFEGEDDFKWWNKNNGFILGTGDNKIRSRIAEKLMNNNEKMLTIIHPSAIVSSKVTIGKGTFVSAQSTINTLSEIGDYAVLNTSSVVEHECSIGAGAHIAPGAVLAGNVVIGKRSFIGANAVIKEGITIGDDVIIGAGATIISDITNGKKVVGNPGREI